MIVRASQPGALAHASNVAMTASRSANTSGWSHSALRMTARSGRYGSKLPAYSSASTTKASPLPQRAVDAGASRSGGIRAPTNAAGSRPAPTSAWTSHPVDVDLPWVPATPTSVPPWVAAASATTCCQASTAMPAARAAASSGWSGETDVSAFVTPSLETIPAPARSTTCEGSCSVATTMPAASSAAVYGDGAPGSQAVTSAPAECARSAAAEAPAPAAPMMWMRSPGSIGRGARAGARPWPTFAPLTARRRGRSALATVVRAAGPRRLRRSNACSRSGPRPRRGAGRSCHRRPRPRRT